MAIELSLVELESPLLQFGGAATASNPKAGLIEAGPFDMRFGAARKDSISVGLIGPSAMIEATLRWLDRCEREIPALVVNSALRRPFPGFSAVFRKRLITSDLTNIPLDSDARDSLETALASGDPYKQFAAVVDLYGSALSRLASRDHNRPDVVLVCVPKIVRDQIGSVERDTSDETRIRANAIRKARDQRQLEFFDLLDEVEESEEDLLKRDLRHALKAKALAAKLPIQIVTPRLIEDATAASEDPATRAWNFTVGLYYKSGGVPWRVQPAGPSTCYVGVSFHHFQTTRRHLVQSSVAHAFSSDGEGFAIRGTGVPVEPNQRLNVHLSHDQARFLGDRILAEYAMRTGGSPLRIVIHKSSHFDESEIAGFGEALRDVPITNLVTMTPSAFRLLRFGSYPPRVGTVCTVNGARTYLYTSGFVPELATYPGSHIPQPFEVRSIGGEPADLAAADIFKLTRMNWNTADLRGKWPVTLSFARRVSGILNEYGEDDPTETSFRYFV